MSARRLTWLTAPFAIAFLIAAGVMAYYFADYWGSRDYRIVRIDSTSFIVALVAFPIFGTAAVMSLTASFVKRARRGVVQPLFAWLAVACIAALLASVSVGERAWIAWGESYRRVEALGTSEPGSLLDLLMPFAPFITIPLLGVLGWRLLSAALSTPEPAEVSAT
jgi:hypothetical protein